MKARIVTKISERVLSYAIGENLQPLLSAVLQELSIEEYRVSSDELQQDVGYLAGFPGFPKKTGALSEPISCAGVLCMSGLSESRMDTLFEKLDDKKIDIPLMAIVTATNQRWSFGQLIRELNEERKAILQQQNHQA